MKNELSLEELKAKYGEIKEVSCGKLVAYFRKPDMKIWRYAIPALSESKTAFKLAMTKSLFVGGSDELIQEPYVASLLDIIDEFIDYATADYEKNTDGTYTVTVLDKSAILKAVSVETQIDAERKNPDSKAFMTRENILTSLWVSGDNCLKDEKQIDYYMPMLRVVEKLKENHILRIKNA